MNSEIVSSLFAGLRGAALPDVVWPAAAKGQPCKRENGPQRQASAAPFYVSLRSEEPQVAKPVYLCARAAQIGTVASLTQRPARARAARATGLCRLNCEAAARAACVSTWLGEGDARLEFLRSDCTPRAPSRAPYPPATAILNRFASNGGSGNVRQRSD